jgi:hypothetical protein
MDRLQPLSTLAALTLAGGLFAAACKDKDTPASERQTRERSETVEARPEDRRTPGEVCDRLPPAARAPRFDWPALTGEAPSPTKGRWLWVNVWATWCRPCIEELPRLTAWRDRLRSRGAKLDLVLLSADSSDREIAAFRAEHPGTPPSLRLVDTDRLPAWVKELGIAGASLPVHVLVDGNGRLRCARASGVGEGDYEAFETLVLGR